MVELKTFGGLSVAVDGAPAPGAGRQPKALALLALLAASRQGVSRDKLVAYLWPDRDAPHARGLLKQTCYALRRDLNTPDLFVGAAGLALNAEVMTTDVCVFEDALVRHDMPSAAVCYKGPFLDGFYLREAPEFERWVEAERARYAREACDALERLARDAAARGDAGAAVTWWRRRAELDPISAHAALGLMRALDDAGERAEAVRFGRRYEALVWGELDVEPAAEVAQLIETFALRSGELVKRRASPRPSPVQAPAMAPAARARQVVLPVGLAGLVTVLVTVAFLASSRKAPAVDPHVIVVVPFDIGAPALETWRADLASVLSRRLDRTGPYRATIAGAEGGDGRFVLDGRLMPAGPDSVRITATLLESERDRALVDLDRTEAADRLGRAADSLALDVVRALVVSQSLTGVKIRSLRAVSRPALQAYLAGETYLRRMTLDSAVAAFDRATTLDSTFAVAWRAAGLARAWNRQEARSAWARAAGLNHGLDRRDSLLIVADSQNLAEFNRPYAMRRIQLLQEILHDHPDDAAAWFALGDTRFHMGPGDTWDDARAAFDRAIALDSSFALAYVHPVQIALREDDREAALRYVRGFLAIDSVDPAGAGMAMLCLLLENGVREREAFQRALDTASSTSLLRLLTAIAAWPDERETQIRVARQLVANARAGRLDEPGDANMFHAALADALTFRGRLAEARAAVKLRTQLELPAFLALANLGANPPDTVASQLLDRLGWVAGWSCETVMDVALWLASRRDTTSLERLVRDQDSLALLAAQLGPASPMRPIPLFTRAALALSRGDTTAARRTFVYAADPLCHNSARPRREIQFRLLIAAGRDADATWIFDRMYHRRVPMLLERARLAERMGDSAAAVKYYDLAVRAWRGADPELQPIVAEARAALQRLEVEPRR